MVVTWILARVLRIYLLSFLRFWTLPIKWFSFLFWSILNDSDTENQQFTAVFLHLALETIPLSSQSAEPKPKSAESCICCTRNCNEHICFSQPRGSVRIRCCVGRRMASSVTAGGAQDLCCSSDHEYITWLLITVPLSPRSSGRAFRQEMYTRAYTSLESFLWSRRI